MSKSDKCKGDGFCFEQSTLTEYSKKETMKKCPCKLSKCECCKSPRPEWYLNCHWGKCTNCAINCKYDGQCLNVVTHCITCGKKLVPIGDKRANGKSGKNDWATRKQHKKCWLEEKRRKEK